MQAHQQDVAGFVQGVEADKRLGDLDACRVLPLLFEQPSQASMGGAAKLAEPVALWRNPVVVARGQQVALVDGQRLLQGAAGGLRVTGLLGGVRVAQGRKQYRYHPRWREARDATKYTRMILFGHALPRIRERVEQDLARPGLPKAKVLAAVVRLLEETHIRVGNDEYATKNNSYGLTTMLDEHVNVSGAKVVFEFRGKSGKDHQIDIKNRRLAGIVKRCQDLPGQRLFQYLDEDGETQSIASGDVNAYLKEISAEDFTAKDFRTWAGTVLAAQALWEQPPATSPTAAKKVVVQAIDNVAGALGNTRAVCRKSYIHPNVIGAYMDGTLRETLERHASEEGVPVAGLRPEERALLGFLEDCA